MIRSMTGYSRVETEEDGLAVTVSIRATNHRFLDPQLRLPTSLDSLEAGVRRLLKEHVLRGHVEITVGVGTADQAAYQVDRKLLGAYLKGYETLKQEFGAVNPPDVVALLRVPGMLVAGNGEVGTENPETLRSLVEQTVTRALADLNAMRAVEGEALERDIIGRLTRLEELHKTVSRLAEQAPQYYRARLEGRIRELMGGVELDRGRLAQEVAYLASRSDIAEELTRLASHFDQVRRLFAESAEAGKKLDFLLQEMNREANTLLSKTTDVPEVGPEITRNAIEMKTEIEKLREQALNIE